MSVEIHHVPPAAPRDGIAGLRAHGLQDAAAGLTVVLLALPLSLGIAKASDFPPVMGLLTAILGGLLAGALSGARLTIKGPAAGLIVIVAGAVAEFGGGEAGWRLSLAAVAAAGIVQILFGAFRLGKWVDFFPLSAIHGMLAAIGLTIIAKQIPVLLDIDPALTKGKPVFELIASTPAYLAHLDPRATLIGVISLAVMAGWPLIRMPLLRSVPAPVVVLLIAVPAELLMDFQHTEPPYALVHIGPLADNLGLQADFSALARTGLFVKYTVMFALVGSLESLLTVRAVDLLDPWRRRSDPNRDLIAVGTGNLAAGLLGGLPMISEVARSSANVSAGARTKWANVFHGAMMLLFVGLGAPLIELIPNTALAAMLITVGVRLAHPREFIQTFRIGWEQLAIFLTTIAVTLAEDLLVGILAGIALKLIIHLFHGAPVAALFKSQAEVSFEGNAYLVRLSHAAVFSNFLGIKDKLESIPPGFHITVDLQHTRLVDHSVMESLHRFAHAYEAQGGTVRITGLDRHRPVSRHQFATHRMVRRAR
ncbi:MAG: SulP family inorganic anion transporter [Bacteroidia bacterium]|nr:SulP family inorganic anion transporter [Bacteroidia bacterium]